MTNVLEDIAKTKEMLLKQQEEVQLKLKELEAIEIQAQAQTKAIKEASAVINEKLGNLVDQDAFFDFFAEPWFMKAVPKKDYVEIYVPKFVRNFQAGWITGETKTYYIYAINRFSKWFGEIPKELLPLVDFPKEVEGYIDGDRLRFSPEWKDRNVKKLRLHLDDITENEARIIKGHEFDLIRDMVLAGHIPYRMAPVAKEDLRPAQGRFELLPHQRPAEDKFLQTGAIGVFLPTGAGKSFIFMRLADMLKGRKILFVHSRTTAEQFAWYFEKYIPHCKDEIKITTYNGYRADKEEYILAGYDECQYIAADTFSRVSTINTKYRVGMSATPMREDGREELIFALTGHPVGVNWQEYMKQVKRNYHPIYVHVIKQGKIYKVKALVDFSKKTVIFCDSIDLGRQIATELQVPHIYGETKDRLDLINASKVMVMSRVGDLGVSIKDLQRIIEVDFLFGSRQQEVQRTGRLMHSNASGLRHDIIMTQKEYDDYGKRLWGLQEKGFTVKVVEE